MITFHSMMVIIHSPADLVGSWVDDAWVSSPDFLVAVEHADICSAWLDANMASFDFAGSHTKLFLERIFCLHLMVVHRLTDLDPAMQPMYVSKVEKHILALQLIGRNHVEQAIRAKILSLFLGGHFIPGLSPKEFLQQNGFSDLEQRHVLEANNVNWPAPLGGFIGQLYKLIVLALGIKT
jgi:hypothetical protein